MESDVVIECVDFNMKLHELYAQDDSVQFRTLVLKYRIDVDAPNKEGKSVLHVAACDGKTTWIEMLLSLGAAIDEPDEKMRWSAIQWARYCCKNDTYRKLLSYRALDR